MRTSFALALALCLSGCPTENTTDTGPVTFPDCEAIVEACHEVDPGSGPAHDCHEAAHDAASNDVCVPLRASCLATCEAIDGGVIDEDAGATEDAPHDHDAGA